MLNSCGAVYVAIGERAQEEARTSVASLVQANPSLDILTIDAQNGGDPKRASRDAKTSLPSMAQNELTVYLDADTRPQGCLDAAFEALDDGFDMALAISDHQGDDAFWHVAEQERAETFLGLGYVPLQWQCGVLFFRKSEAVRAFFEAWHQEWERYADEDQAAFVRALHRCPLKVWALGRPWNGGPVVQHLHGRCRR